MQYRWLFGLVLSFVANAFCLFAADVTGTWRTQLPNRQGGDHPYSFELVQKPDGAVTGTVVGFRSEGKVQDGKIDGGQIRFSAKNQYMARKVLMTFDGTVSGGEMRLVVSFEDTGERLKLVAKRD